MPINIQWGSLFEPCKLILKLMHKNNKTTLGRKKKRRGSHPTDLKTYYKVKSKFFKGRYLLRDRQTDQWNRITKNRIWFTSIKGLDICQWWHYKSERTQPTSQLMMLTIGEFENPIQAKKKKINNEIVFFPPATQKLILIRLNSNRWKTKLQDF